MPDLVTHIASGIALGGLFHRAEYTSAFVVGACLPDLLGRVPTYGLIWLQNYGVCVPDSLLFGMSFLHLPLGGLAATALLSLLAVPSRRLEVWGALYLGAVLHMGLDALQSHWGAAYEWFYPFSDWSWEAGLIGSEATVWLAPALLVLAVFGWRLRHGKFLWSRH